MKKYLLFLILIIRISANAQCWSKISAGDYHTLAIDIDGKLWAWGSNYTGELGDGSLELRSTPVFINGSSWLDISAGLSHSIGLKTNGTIWSWGRNGSGQLGDNSTTDTSSPIQIGSRSDWTGIAAGANHSTAINSDGTLWSWGSDEYGQLGNGGTNTSLINPTQVDNETNWQKVFAGEFNTFAIKQDGTLWGCGRNDVGQVGDGTKINKNMFVQIGTETNWLEISVGKYFTVGLKTDGTLWAWGDNYYGQLGDGTNIGKSTPTQVGSDTNWQIIACGPEHTIAQKANGNVLAWGHGQNGALGIINSETDFNIPTLINITNLQSISSGSLHSLAVKNDNKLWAWGTNVTSQFGNGNNLQSLTPLEVDCPSLLGVTDTKTTNLSTNVYPNPTSDFLNINYRLLHDSYLTIRLVNSMGQLIREYKTNRNSGLFTDIISLKSKPSGLYFLTISSISESQTFKILKK
jgi:alpha-tubulin suppressor-like RCC1 family protein